MIKNLIKFKFFIILDICLLKSCINFVRYKRLNYDLNHVFKKLKYCKTISYHYLELLQIIFLNFKATNVTI